VPPPCFRRPHLKCCSATKSACSDAASLYNSGHVAAQQSERKQQRPDSAVFSAAFN
jgi:hypothetical protein